MVLALSPVQSSQPKAQSLEEFIRYRVNWCDSDDQALQWARWRKWEEFINFYRGQQLIKWEGDIYSGKWQTANLQSGDPYYPSNVTRDFINAVLAELVRTDPALMVQARSDQPHQIDAATAARAVLMQDEQRVWDATKKERFYLFLLLCGNAFLYTSWLPKAGAKVQIPKFTEQPMQPPGAQVTPPVPEEIGEGEMTPTFDPMQQGQVPMVGQPDMMQQFSGTEEIQDGIVDTIIPPPTSIKVHLLARDLSETPYLAFYSSILEDDFWRLYPNANPGTASSTDMRSVIERALEAMPGNVTMLYSLGQPVTYTLNSTTRQGMVMLNRYWFRPSLYWNVITEKESVVAGMTIPAGVALKDLFPNGMYVAWSGTECVDIADRKLDDEWVHVGYNTNPFGFWADGLEDIISQQRELNELRSIQIENALFNAAPPTYYNPTRFKSIGGGARRKIPMEGATPDDDPSKFVFAPPAREVASSLIQMQQSIKGDMQLHSSAPVGDSGIPGATASTATGMQIIADWTKSKLGRYLASIVRGRIKRAEQDLRFRQKYWISTEYIRIANVNGVEDGRWFKAADIQGDFEIIARDGSWLPRTQSEIKDNLLQYFVAGGVPFGALNPQFPRSAAAMLARVLGFPLDFDGYSVHVRKQQMEIDYIKTAVQVSTGKGLDPAMFTSLSVPVEPTDEDSAHIETITNYLNTDIGMRETPEVKQALYAHMDAHEQAQMTKQMRKMAMAFPGGMMPLGGGGGPDPGPSGEPPIAGEGQGGAPPQDGQAFG